MKLASKSNQQQLVAVMSSGERITFRLPEILDIVESVCVLCDIPT